MEKFMKTNIFKSLKSFIFILSILSGISITACSTAASGDPYSGANSDDGNAIAYFLCEQLCNSQDETVKLCFYSDGTVKLRATSLEDKAGKYGQRYDKLRGTYTGDPNKKNGNLELSIKEEVEWKPYAPKDVYSSIEEAEKDIHWKPVYHTYNPSNGETKWQGTITDDVLKFSNGTYKNVTTSNKIYDFNRTTSTDLGPYVYHNVARRKYNGTLTSWQIPEGYSSVGNFCFYGYEYKNGDYNLSQDYNKLKKVILPSTIKKIGDQAFKNCFALKEINIPEGCIEIGQGAFSDCSSLEKITLPSTIKSIGACAFAKECEDSSLEAEEGAKNILEITFAEGITKIPESCFDMGYKYHISEIKTVIIPSSVKVIGEKAFFDIGTPITVIIPDSVEEIEDMAFSHCVASISLPKSLKKIGKEAFYCNQAEKIEIPEGVEEIGANAFVQGYDEDEIKLKELVLPSTLKTLNSSSFSLKKLQKLTFKGSISFLCSIVDAWRLYINSDCLIFYESDDVTDYFTKTSEYDYYKQKAFNELADTQWLNDSTLLSFNSDRLYTITTVSEIEKGLWKIDSSTSQYKLVFYTGAADPKEYYYITEKKFLYMEETFEELQEASKNYSYRFTIVEES